MKHIIGINHVGLRVQGLDVARAFYEQLGIEFIVGPIGPKPVAMMMHTSPPSERATGIIALARRTLSNGATP